MKNTILFILILCICVSCTGNTIYKEPKDLISRDTMINLIVDLHFASSAKPIKNLELRRDLNYTQLVYEKYKIDSLRFETSNIYYTSKIDEYDKLLKEVRRKIEVIASTYQLQKNTRDSIKKDSIEKIQDTLPTEELDSAYLKKRNALKSDIIKKGLGEE